MLGADVKNGCRGADDRIYSTKMLPSCTATATCAVITLRSHSSWMPRKRSAWSGMLSLLFSTCLIPRHQWPPSGAFLAESLWTDQALLPRNPSWLVSGWVALHSGGLFVSNNPNMVITFLSHFLHLGIIIYNFFCSNCCKYCGNFMLILITEFICQWIAVLVQTIMKVGPSKSLSQ